MELLFRAFTSPQEDRLDGLLRSSIMFFSVLNYKAPSDTLKVTLNAQHKRRRYGKTGRYKADI